MPHIAKTEGRARATRVAASGSLREFGAWWPHANVKGNTGSSVFQSAEILDAWCHTIGKASHVAPLFVTVFGSNGEPALLLALGLENRN